MKNKILKFSTYLILFCLTCLITYKLHYRIINLKNSLLLTFNQLYLKKEKAMIKEEVLLAIDSSSLEILQKMRDVSFEKSFIGNNEKKKVKANIIWNNISYSGRIKLAGRGWDHLGGKNLEKTSLSVNLAQGDKFALRHPATRSYLYEWILHKAFINKKIPTTKYSFVNVSINKKDMGIYAMESRFGNNFFKENSIEQGLVLKFDYMPTLQEYMKQTKYVSYKSFNSINSFVDCKIQCYKSDLKNIKDMKKMAIDIIESFRNINGTLNGFELKSWAKYFAIVDLFGANHAAQWSNIRFYFNPNTKKIYPVGYDGTEVREKSLLLEAFYDDPIMKNNELFLRKFF
jgi:hypothetical protein